MSDDELEPLVTECALACWPTDIAGLGNESWSPRQLHADGSDTAEVGVMQPRETWFDGISIVLPWHDNAIPVVMVIPLAAEHPPEAWPVGLPGKNISVSTR